LRDDGRALHEPHGAVGPAGLQVLRLLGHGRGSVVLRRAVGSAGL
jgi:hypothetical protein